MINIDFIHLSWAQHLTFSIFLLIHQFCIYFDSITYLLRVIGRSKSGYKGLIVLKKVRMEFKMEIKGQNEHTIRFRLKANEN